MRTPGRARAGRGRGNGTPSRDPDPRRRAPARPSRPRRPGARAPSAQVARHGVQLVALEQERARLVPGDDLLRPPPQPAGGLPIDLQAGPVDDAVELRVGVRTVVVSARTRGAAEYGRQ